MKHTDEQTEIIEKVSAGCPKVLVNACAGSGKSTTLRGVVGALDTQARTLVCMFNKSAQKDFSERLSGGRADVRTTHSLAYGSVVAGSPGYKAKLNGKMTLTGLCDILSLKDLDERYFRINQDWRGKLGLKKGLNKFKIASLIKRTAERYTHSPDFMLEPKHIPKPFWHSWDGVNPIVWEYVKDKAGELWDLMKNPENNIPISHDTYLKIWQLKRPVLNYDFVLVDEAQDTNPVLLSIFKDYVEHAKNPHLVAVGDTFQSIYAFRGAIDALETLGAYGGFEKLYLTKSFRYGPEVAEKANLILSFSEKDRKDIRGFEGLDTKVTKIEPLREKTTILCRTNANVLTECADLSEYEDKIHICVDVSNLINYVESALALKKGKLKLVKHYELRQYNTWQEFCKEAEVEKNADMIRVAELVESNAAPDLCVRLKKVKNIKEEKAKVVISTAHKAKGREWENVQISDDFRNPVSTAGVNEQELNLLYVAMTRAWGKLDLSRVSFL